MRFNIVACTLLILSVFSFVLAAPVTVREVRRAGSDSELGTPPQSPSAPDYASGGKSPMRSTPGESKVPWAPGRSSMDAWSTDAWSDSEWTPPQSPSAPSRGKSPTWSTPGESKGPWDPEGASEPGTTTGNQPASSSQAKKNQWASTPEGPSSTPGRDKKVQWGATNYKFVFEKEKDPLPLPPGRDGYLAKQAAQTLPTFKSKSKGFTPGMVEVPLGPEGASEPGTTTEHQPASSSQGKDIQWESKPEGPPSTPGRDKKVNWGPMNEVYVYKKDPLPLPPGRDGYLAKQAAQTLPKSNSGLMGNVKSYLGKLGKNIRPRFRRTVDTGA